jgi:NTP pyrophosphatase (non-canonical NTP hydrolase)
MTRQHEREQRVQRAAERAVLLWGVERQLRQLTEECGELVAAINQHARERITEEELAYEVADVWLCVAQARHVLGQRVDVAIANKLARLEQRIASEIEERGGLYRPVRLAALPDNDNGGAP